ncbi:O-Glycosyl hydrolases family 17 protein [Striga asiatica]|uniref:O-Glycosyl hydrolases family 17 protein n=1 Tax=Striga asiatica TaxID=4170 RepID=A0A5A7PZB9_STRAF|nr:O-Glycosyl hydrolases family 17 protein [Striga asiatica]
MSYSKRLCSLKQVQKGVFLSDSEGYGYLLLSMPSSSVSLGARSSSVPPTAGLNSFSFKRTLLWAPISQEEPLFRGSGKQQLISVSGIFLQTFMPGELNLKPLPS